MGKWVYIFWTIVGLTLSIPDNKGTEFFVSFGAILGINSNPCGIALYSEQTATVEVSCISCSWQQTVTIPSFSRVVVNIQNLNLPLSTPGINQRSLYIKSVDPTKEIAVYTFCSAVGASTYGEMMAVLPVDVLGTTYIATSFRDFTNDRKGWIAVTATEDNTLMNITGPANGGILLVGNNVQLASGKTQTFQLQKYQSFYALGFTSSVEITGTRISADKKVAVTAGHECAGTSTLCNYLQESMLPVESWGMEYVVAPLRSNGGDTIRVTSNTDGNFLTVNGQLAANINRGGYFNFVIAAGTVITSTAPISVTQITAAPTWTQITIPSFAQTASQYDFISRPGSSTTNLLIVIQDGNQGGLQIDGSLFTATWNTIAGSNFVFARVTIGDGVHRIIHSSPIARYSVIAWSAVGDGVYGYPTSFRVAPLTPCTPSNDSIPSDGLDNDCDGRIDEELANSIDDDGDSIIDEDIFSPPGSCCELTPPPLILGAESLTDITVQCGQTFPPAATLTATLYCPELTNVQISPQVSTSQGNCAARSQITRVWQVTDECGRTSTASQIIYIEDSIAPSVTAPSKVTLECGSLPLPFNTGFANASDTCSPTQAPTYRDYTITRTCPNIATITRYWQVTDDCGNIGYDSQIIDIVDSTPPTTSASNVCVYPPNGQWKCFDTVKPSFVSATDACSNTTLQFNNDCVNLDTHDSSGCQYNSATRLLCLKASKSSTYSFTFTFTDACGNSATQRVTVPVSSVNNSCVAPDTCLNSCPEYSCEAERIPLYTKDNIQVGYAVVQTQLNDQIFFELNSFIGSGDRGWWITGFVLVVGGNRLSREFIFGSEKNRWFENIDLTSAFTSEVTCNSQIEIFASVQVTNDKLNRNSPKVLSYLKRSASETKRAIQLPPDAAEQTIPFTVCCECTFRTVLQPDYRFPCSPPSLTRDLESARLREISCRRDNAWRLCMTNGLTIGCSLFNATWTTPTAIASYFADENLDVGPLLNRTWVNPPNRALGQLAGEVAALSLSLAIDECDADFASSCLHYSDLRVCQDPNNAGRTECQPFWGLSVGEILEQANLVLGGCQAGNSTQLVTCVSWLNRAFEGGKRAWQNSDFRVNSFCPV